MARRVLSGYESSEVATVVKAWLERTGIDPNLVVGWKINQRGGEPSQIELTMYFDDAPVPPPGNFGPGQPRMPLVGEQGPELPNVAFGGRFRRHTTCAEATPFPGGPKEYVCTGECPGTEDARVIKIDREE